MCLVLPRFLARDVDAHDSRLSLVAEEADHAIRVLRLKPGEAVRVFNGRGDEFEGLIESIERGRAIVAVGERAAPAAESRVAVTLAQVVLKHDLMDEVVRDAVMFGVAAIQPVLSARSEVSAAALSRGHKRERWERIAVSSTKQCGRAVVPRIGEPVTFEDAVNLVGTAGLPAPALMLVEPAVSSAHAAGPHLPPALLGR
jgi:16S rRNA (uracil1498-N3)-methyltransferase